MVNVHVVRDTLPILSKTAFTLKGVDFAKLATRALKSVSRTPIEIANS